MDVFQEAERQFNRGNFKQAIRLYESFLAEGEIDLEAKVEANEKIKYAKKFYEEVIPQNSGEALFPVVDKHNEKFDSVYKLVITNKLKEEFRARDFELSEKNVFKILQQFLDNKIEKSDKPIAVFDWGFEKFSAKIKEPFPNFEFTNLVGDSMQLAMAIALVSMMINEKVPLEFAFSGNLSLNGNNVVIGKVNDLDRKAKAIAREREEVKEFITHEKYSSLDDVLQLIFGEDYLDKIIEKYVKTNASYISIKFRNTQGIIEGSNAKVDIEVWEFNDVEFKTSQERKKFNSLLEKIFTGDKKKDKGIIIDGLRANFTVGIFVANATNKFSNFLAVRNTQIGGINGYERASIVIDISRTQHEIEIGDIVYYFNSGKTEQI